MKILHIIESLGMGGAEKLLVGIINGLDGHEQHLIVMYPNDSLRSLIIQPVNYLNLGVTSRFGMLTKAGKLKRYLRKHDIDIVHTHLYQANILSRLGAGRRYKVINTIHAISSVAAYDGNRVWLWLEKLSYKKRHRLIAVSQAVLDDFKKYVGIKGKATVLYNFINEEFFSAEPKSSFSENGLRLVAVGRLIEQKNFPYLIETFKQLPATVSLDIYGEGPLHRQLEDQIKKYQLNIRLCGVSRKLHEVLQQYDAFVMSSIYEGQPLALLEAMASGLPSFLSSIPELKEVAGNHALYFDINDPTDLARQIRSVLNGEIDLRPLAAAGWARVNEFAHRDQYIEKLDLLYREN